MTHWGVWLAHIDLAQDGDLSDEFTTLAVDAPGEDLAACEV